MFNTQAHRISNQIQGLVTIYLKDAYFHISIRLVLETYQYQVIPFGLALHVCPLHV